jgi:hypothetical protein
MVHWKVQEDHVLDKKYTKSKCNETIKTIKAFKNTYPRDTTYKMGIQIFEFQAEWMQKWRWHTPEYELNVNT